MSSSVNLTTANTQLFCSPQSHQVLLKTVTLLIIVSHFKLKHFCYLIHSKIIPMLDLVKNEKNNHPVKCLEYILAQPTAFPVVTYSAWQGALSLIV